MTFIVVLLLLILVCFAGVVLVGAPYLPTLSPQVKAALALADLQPGDTLLELGCGDGKVLIAAAQAGIKSVGYELNPILASVAWLRTRCYSDLVTVKLADFWHTSLPPADAVFVFLLPKYMPKLNKKFMQYNHKPVKLVSFAFKIPGKHSDAEKEGVYLYIYS